MNTDYKETGREDDDTVSDVNIADNNGIRQRLWRDGNQAQNQDTASDGNIDENSQSTEEITHGIESAIRTENSTLQEHVPKHETSRALWIMGSINIVFLLVIVYLILSITSIRSDIRELRTDTEDIELDIQINKVQKTLVKELKSIRAEIDSLRNNVVSRHDEQEAELNNKILKLKEYFEEFKHNLNKPAVTVYAPYEEMEAQLEDLNAIQNILQTTSASLGKDSKERWLTEYENAKSMFDKHENIKPLKSQKIELDALIDKSELFTFAMALKDDQKYRKALGLYKKIYKRSRITLGSDHENTLTAQRGAAICLTDLDDHNKALELYRLVYERRREASGPTHAATLSAQHNMALSLHRLGKNARALHMLEEVYSMEAKTLGLNHKNTLLTKRNMEIVKNII